MIWISTLCLLAIASWLFFNALNERRWVEAHSHDETVASDEGLLPNFTSLTRSALPAGGGKLTIDQENTPFAKAVTKVRQKTADIGERVFESKVAAARIDDPAQRPASAKDENTLFGRMVARVAAKSDAMDSRLDGKIKAAASMASGSIAAAAASGESFFEKTSRKVAMKSNEVTEHVARVARNRAAGISESRGASAEDGVFGKVAGKLENYEANAAKRRMARSRVATGKPKTAAKPEDLMTRVSEKVGAKINEIDSKFAGSRDSSSDKTDT